jgi:hypothetical protein
MTYNLGSWILIFQDDILRAPSRVISVKKTNQSFSPSVFDTSVFFWLLAIPQTQNGNEMTWISQRK